MSDKHKRLALQPSSASRWTVCKASPGFIVRMADQIQDESSEWADEGKDAHDLGAKMLRNEPWTEARTDMVVAVQSYVDFVRDKVQPGTTLFVEQKVPLFYHEERNGYIDAAIIGEKSIYIADLKYGTGISVEAKKNKQLAIYGLSFIKHLVDTGLYDSFAPDTLVTLAIFQPRARDGRVTRIWPLTFSELLDFCAEIQAVASDILANPDAQPFHVDDDTCRFCPANSVCGERAKALLGDMPPEVQKPLEAVLTLPDVGSLSVETLAKIVLASKPLEKFFEAARARAFGILEGGTTVPGLKLVQGRSSRSWKDEAEVKRLLLLKLPVDEAAPRELVSPAQAEKLLKAVKPGTRFENLLNAQIVKKTGGPTLVPDSDSRPALELTNGTENFTNLDAPASEPPSPTVE